MAALGINLGFLLVQIFNFAIVAIVLAAWVYNPVVKYLEDRKQRIAQALEDARVASEARANAEKAAAKITADAQADANRRIAEATERAEKVAGEMRAAADEERVKLLASAREDVPRSATASWPTCADRWPPWPFPRPTRSSVRRWMSSASMP